MNELVFDHTINILPVTWKRARSAGTRRYNEKQMEVAKATIGWEVKAHEPKLRPDDTARFGVRMTFYLPGHRGGDGDRYENLVLDALKGIVWADDEQVDEGTWRKMYHSDPKIQLTIYHIGPTKDNA